MATTTQNAFQPRIETGLPAIVRSFTLALRAARTTRQERARLLNELSQCSDRELADMNLSRADIDYVVRNWQPA